VSVVFAQRADEGVGCGLLHDVCGPAGNAADDEDRGERGGIKAHEVVRGPGRVVEVGLNGLGLVHGLFQTVVQPKEFGPAGWVALMCERLGCARSGDRLFGSHSDCAVKADGFTVEHGITDDVGDQSSVLGGLTESGGVRYLLAEGFLGVFG
jgi:hypothetical protein